MNTDLDLLSGEGAHDYAIAKSGAVSGEAVVPGGEHSQAVLWKNKEIQPLGPCCNRTARGMNAQGQVVGDLYDDRGRYHAYLWTRDTGMREIGPPDEYSSAIAINDRGRAVLQGFPGVFLYDEKEGLTKLTLPTKYPAQPRAMNDCDVIVGSFGPVSDANRAFIWDRPSGFHDLNKLLVDAAGWKLKAALAINDRGEIAGVAEMKGKEDTGYLLTPAPGPP